MTHDNAVLWPMAAMAALTFFVLSVVPFFRVGDTVAGRVHPREFKLGESDKVPERTRLINRNYMNLLELPALFYPVCLILYVTHMTTPTLLTLAWAFVGLRALHSLIHLTINHVLARFAVFATSTACLALLWCLTFVRLATH